MSRLIDADALIKRLAYCVKQGMGATIAYTFMHMIDDEPTVDAVEVVHGEWKPLRGKYAECSACEEAYYMPHMRWSNFCPNCGTKMDGERKESE